MMDPAGENWHALPYESVFEKLQSSKSGLDAKEVKRRLEKFGPNKLQAKAGENFFWIFFRQFHNPLIYILLASTALALFLGKMTDAAVVFSVVILNTIIGFIQEYRSNRAIHALLQIIPQKSTVIREGIALSIPSSGLVPGDVLVLQSGDRIAADIRLFTVKNLGCDESALTGESLPALKRILQVSSDSQIAERKCMAYNGTLVTSGTGMGIVVATGTQTEFGKISELLEEVSSFETPLKKTLENIAGWVTFVVFIMSLGLFGIGYFRGYSMLNAVLASIALAVAAIPEGLPVTITIAAAVGVQRMARRQAIIRQLLAVETLGSTTVICTDKTGTLTQNEMTVQLIWTPKGTFFVTGIGYSKDGQIVMQKSPSRKDSDDALKELLKVAVLCNDASLGEKQNKLMPSGDPTEIALLIVGIKGGLEEAEIRKNAPRIDVIPFESERMMMATLHTASPNANTILLKGAPEAIIKRCKQGSAPLADSMIEMMAKEGMRVIAIARKDVSSKNAFLEESDIEDGFVLLGLLGMVDPLRNEVREAVKNCQTAGITVKMITGDHPLTAGIIGKELGILGDKKVILGSELDRLSRKELQELVNQNHIFARGLPQHKVKIMEALQDLGHIVAMTGDGVNDAPALKRANIGIAMGISGTAVAKEAADIILADDNFATIEAAVEEGRRVYDNLIKSIIFMFPTNLAQSLVILVAVMFFPIHDGVLLLPILPVQILWVNLIVAVALALPLAFEAMEPDIMKRPPRNANAPLLNKFVCIRTLTVAIIMTAGTIALFFWEYFHELAKGTEEIAAISEAQTMAVTTLVFFQVFYLFNCRSQRYSIFKIGFFSNPYVLFGIGFIVLAQISFVYLPFMNWLFSSLHLDFEAWMHSIAIALIILPIIAFEKWAQMK